VSPLPNAVTAQANASLAHGSDSTAIRTEAMKSSKKIGRQLSVNSTGNHYADNHRHEVEKVLNGIGGMNSPSTQQKESFFSHLRKRARRLSGRNQIPASSYDIEASAGCVPWSNRSSMTLDTVNLTDSKSNTDFSELDKALQSVKYALDSTPANVQTSSTTRSTPSKRQAIPQGPVRSILEGPTPLPAANGPVSSRTRRALQMTAHPIHRYETPEEEDELLDEVLRSTHKAAKRLAKRSDDDTGVDSRKDENQQTLSVHISPRRPLPNPYPTPSPSAKCDGVSFGDVEATPPRAFEAGDAKTDNEALRCQWPTPPYGGNEWASSSASILATDSVAYNGI
jgi:meiosis induction protein kinase IME2/SME1